jgi:hypothetical protein
MTSDDHTGSSSYYRADDVDRLVAELVDLLGDVVVDLRAFEGRTGVPAPATAYQVFAPDRPFVEAPFTPRPGWIPPQAAPAHRSSTTAQVAGPTTDTSTTPADGARNDDVKGWAPPSTDAAPVAVPPPPPAVPTPAVRRPSPTANDPSAVLPPRRPTRAANSRLARLLGVSGTQ